MTKNSTLKNLLRTTAIVGTLFMGSQTWAAATYQDAAGTAIAATDDIAAAPFASLNITDGTSPVANHSGAITLQANEVFLISSINNTVSAVLTHDTGAFTLENNSRVIFLPGESADTSTIVVSSTIAGSATGVNFDIYGNMVLPDMSAQPGVNLNILGNVAGNTTANSVILVGNANGFGGTIDIASGRTLVQDTWTRVGGLSGAGALASTTAPLTVTGDVIGTLTMTQGAFPFSVLGNMTTTGTTTLGSGETWTVLGNASLGAVALDGLLNIGGNYAVGGTATFGSAGILKVAGALTGTGQLDMTNTLLPFTHTGSTSGFTGAVVLPTAANVTFANAPKSAFTNLNGNSLTFTNGGTVTSITTAATGGTIAGGTGGDLTITTLNQGNGHDITLNPGAGKKITVTTLSQTGNINDITIGSGGTMVFSGTVNIDTATHTFGSATTIGTYNVAGAPTAVNINENTTINSLTLGNNNVDFAIAAGKTLTIKAVTGSGNITGSVSGTISVKSSSTFTGDVKTAGTTVLKTN